MDCLLYVGERRQTFEEEDLVEPLLCELFREGSSRSAARPSSDLLAVSSDPVFGVRGHPVETITARDYIPRRGTVVDEEHVVAGSAAYGVLRPITVGIGEPV